MHLEDLMTIERRNTKGEGGWYVADVATTVTLAGPFASERRARRWARAIERWAAERERPAPPYRPQERAVG
jgi:hypothetical protein